jgi:hypothetical protein
VTDDRKTPADRVRELEDWYGEQTASHIWSGLRAEIRRHIAEAEAAERERCRRVIAGLLRQLNEAARRYGAEKDYERAFETWHKALAMAEAMIAVAESEEIDHPPRVTIPWNPIRTSPPDE